MMEPSPVSTKGKELKERYLTDESGERLAVVLSLEEYERLQEAQEELKAIQAFYTAKASGDEAIPFEQAVAEIEGGTR